MGRVSVGVLQAVAVASCFLAGSSLHAQSPESPSTVCSAFETSPIEDGPPQLNVACGQYGVTLGDVDSYELAQFPALQSAVVVTTLEGSRRAFLVMKHGDGSVALEEITSAISLQAGRGAQSNIAVLRLDFASAATGLITAAINSAGANGASPVTIDIAAMVERSRTARGQAQPTGGQ